MSTPVDNSKVDEVQASLARLSIDEVSLMDVAQPLYKNITTQEDLQFLESTSDISDTKSDIPEKSSLLVPAKTFKFTCSNNECAKGYDKKAFESYHMNFCSLECCRKVVDPIRERERLKEEEQLAKNKYMGNLSYGGGAGTR